MSLCHGMSGLVKSVMMAFRIHAEVATPIVPGLAVVLFAAMRSFARSLKLVLMAMSCRGADIVHGIARAKHPAAMEVCT